MYYIGIDLGGTNIKGALVTEEGKILRKDSVPTINTRSYQEIIKDMASLAIGLIESEGISKEQVNSIGVGSPGMPDAKKGVLLYTNNIESFEDVPIRTEIQKYIDLPVYLENDANCAALGECIGGAGKGYSNCVAITLGTGVGSGIVLNKKLMVGSFHGGAELGHMVIVEDGEPCTCGRKGCLEAYCSATALIREAKIAAARYPDSKLNEIVGSDIHKLNAKIPFDAAKMGDQPAEEVIQQFIKHLASGVANILNIFDPEVLVIGGGVCAQGDYIITPLKEKLINQKFGCKEPKTLVRIAELGNDAGLIGAALLGTQ